MRRFLALFLLLAPIAHAQDFPSRPIRVVIPYPPGGLTDVIARLVQDPLRLSLGQPVVIENRGGAAGAIAMREVAAATPDGHTLVLTNNGPTSIVPAMRADAGYDAERSFTPVAVLGIQPLAILLASRVPAQDLAGFIRYARDNPGQLNFASAGIGSLGHLGGLLFASAAGIRVVHVPYQGAAPTLTAVLSGQVEFAVTSYSSAAGDQAAAGRLRLLAVTSAKTWPLLPEVPIVAATLPGFRAEAWHGLLGPAGLPPAVMARLNRAIDKALAIPAVREQFAASGLKVVGGGPELLRDRIAAEVPVWTRLIREGGIRAE